MAKPGHNRCGFSAAVWLLAGLTCGVVGADELSDGQRQILAELDSRWWGWTSKPSPIVPSPKSWTASEERWTFSPGQAIVILTGPQASPQETYIATMLHREFVGRHHMACHVVDSAAKIGPLETVVCLGTPGTNTEVARLCRVQGIEPGSVERPESYALDFVVDPQDGRRWILVAGGDPVGCIHGGFSLMQLFRGAEKDVEFSPCQVRDYPSVAVRSLRGVGEGIGMKLQVHTVSRYLGREVTGDEIHPDELLLACLDWLARNRINCFHVLSGMRNDAMLPARLSHVVTEAHRRGIKVVGGFRPVGTQQGDRSEFPCYCSEADMAKLLGHFRQYLETGCDFLYFMADDYYRDKLAGHCPECIARFGGLAGEQQYVLHQIVDLAHKHGMANHQILFCPTHYDARSPGDIQYLKSFNDDPKLGGIQFTFTYLAEDVIQQRKRLLPNLSYALFYNGPRWLAYYYRESSPATTVLANEARNAMYFPIYYGWHAAQYDPKTGWFVNGTEQVKRIFHEAIPRETARTTLLGNIANYSDSIFKGPMEYALWGHYCWNPAAHDTRQSETMVGETLFGPQSGRILAPLNRLLLDLTRLVYREAPLPDEFAATVEERLELGRFLHRRLRSIYQAHADRVGPGYIPKTQDFYARMGIDDIEKYLSGLSRLADERTR